MYFCVSALISLKAGLKFFVCFIFQDRISQCSLGCPWTSSVDQAGLELRNLPASASQVLGLKACATTTWLGFVVVVVVVVCFLEVIILVKPL